MAFLRKLWHHIGRRGTFLLFFSFLWASTGYRWTQEPPMTDNFITLYKIMPPVFWGWVFIATGIAMGIGAHWKKIDEWSFAISAFVSAFMGFMVALGYVPGVDGPAETGFTVALTYFFYTTFVLVISGWPEAPLGEKVTDTDGS